MSGKKIIDGLKEAVTSDAPKRIWPIDEPYEPFWLEFEPVDKTHLVGEYIRADLVDGLLNGLSDFLGEASFMDTGNLNISYLDEALSSYKEATDD